MDDGILIKLVSHNNHSGCKSLASLSCVLHICPRLIFVQRVEESPGTLKASTADAIECILKELKALKEP